MARATGARPPSGRPTASRATGASRATATTIPAEDIIWALALLPVTKFIVTVMPETVIPTRNPVRAISPRAAKSASPWTSIMIAVTAVPTAVPISTNRAAETNLERTMARLSMPAVTANAFQPHCSSAAKQLAIRELKNTELRMIIIPPL